MAFINLESGERVTLAEFQAITQAERRQRNNIPLEITTDVEPAKQTVMENMRGVPSRGHRLAASLTEALGRRQDGAQDAPFPRLRQPDSGAGPAAAAGKKNGHYTFLIIINAHPSLRGATTSQKSLPL